MHPRDLNLLSIEGRNAFKSSVLRAIAVIMFQIAATPDAETYLDAWVRKTRLVVRSISPTSRSRRAHSGFNAQTIPVGLGERIRRSAARCAEKAPLGSRRWFAFRQPEKPSTTPAPDRSRTDAAPCSSSSIRDRHPLVGKGALARRHLWRLCRSSSAADPCVGFRGRESRDRESPRAGVRARRRLARRLRAHRHPDPDRYPVPYAYTMVIGGIVRQRLRKRRPAGY